MSDHIEAMARAFWQEVKDWTTPSGTDFVKLPLITKEESVAFLIGKGIEKGWAAGVEASIAHKPCGGTGRTEKGRVEITEHGLSGTWDCPGPHTDIDCGDGTKLYADVTKVIWYCQWWQERRYDDQCAEGSRERHAECGWIPMVPLPSEWRIE